MNVSRTDLLIKKARTLSGNEDYDDDYGINDEPFIISLNDAQMEIQSAIVEEDSRAHTTYALIDVVANQESYDVPSAVFIDNLIYNVEYSRNGQDTEYEPLDDSSFREPLLRGEPEIYVVEGGKIYISPVPNRTGAKLRVLYERALDKLDIRRGTVLSATIGASYLFPTTITLDVGADDENLTNAEYVCINDKYGTVRMRNIPILEWDSSTLTITVQTDFEAQSDELAIEVGNYITIGEDTTTHSKLKFVCEPYLYNVAAYDAQRQHSSTDAEEQNGKLKRLLRAITGLYSKLPSGKTSIPERRR